MTTTSMTTPSNAILHGDCLDRLRTFSSESVDAVVTDPPYGLGTKEPTGEEIDHYLAGGALDTGGDFMGKEWEIPPVAVWLECLRVLRPGGHLLAFAGTRTWDIMAAGIAAAGFTDEDTLASEFATPVLGWVHGQGFPKSLDVSKALAKMPGVSPEEVEKWKGFGTALKPSWEPVLVYRKPGSGPYDGPRPEIPFFYCAKVSQAEATKKGKVENTHPTRKPIALMQWLVEMSTTGGQLVLDPYCGSGSTCVATLLSGRRYLGIEREATYHAIAEARIALYAVDKNDDDALRSGFDYMDDLPQEGD
jgi:DNA modification methylase